MCVKLIFKDISQVIGVSIGSLFGLFYVLGIKWDFILKDIRADQLTTELQGMLVQFFPDQFIPHEQPKAH